MHLENSLSLALKKTKMLIEIFRDLFHFMRLYFPDFKINGNKNLDTNLKIKEAKSNSSEIICKILLKSIYLLHN